MYLRLYGCVGNQKVMWVESQRNGYAHVHISTPMELHMSGEAIHTYELMYMYTYAFNMMRRSHL